MKRSWAALFRLSNALLLSSAGAVVMASPANAAPSRFPASTAITLDPHDSKTAYVGATFGLLATHDNGDSFGWICDAASGATELEDPAWVVTKEGTLVGNTAAGVSVSRDGGCTFAYAGGPGAFVLADLTVRPDGALLGVSRKGAVLVSSDDAKSFAPAGAAIDGTVTVQSVRAATDTARLYVSGVRGEGDKRAGVVFVTYNAGMSWVERPFELAAGETGVLVSAIDPKNPERAYVRTIAEVDARARLVVTDDGGKTWRKVYDAATTSLGFALSDDGTKVFAGSHEGVAIAPSDSLKFTKGSSAEANCLAVMGDKLWACSTEKSGFFVGSSKTGGRSLDPKLRLDDLKGALACAPDTSVGKHCTDDWPRQRTALGLPEPGEKVRTRDPGAPALKGRGVRTGSSRSTLRGVSAIVLVAMAGYYALKRLRRRPPR